MTGQCDDNIERSQRSLLEKPGKLFNEMSMIQYICSSLSEKELEKGKGVNYEGKEICSWR